MKKTYQKPSVEVINVNAEQPMMAGSITSVKVTDDVVVEEATSVLSKSHHSLWDDDEEE